MTEATPTNPANPVSAAASPPAVRFTLQEELFIFCSLMLITCVFLPWQVSGDTDVTLWDRITSADSFASALLWIIPPMLMALSLWSVSRPAIRPWFGMASFVAINLIALSFPMLAGGRGYGMQLAGLFAFGLLVLSANPAITRSHDFAMRRLNSQKAEVFTHVGTVLPAIHFSTQEFYAKIESDIRSRNWPGVELLRVAYTEAGLLSHKREYLRVIRQRQVFDICAATFGSDYFFTLREAEI